MIIIDLVAGDATFRSKRFRLIKGRDFLTSRGFGFNVIKKK